jgi:hypothetical protein
MLRRVRRAICRNCTRSLPRAADQCPWCSYGTDEPAKCNNPRHPNDTLPRRSMRLAPHQDISHRMIS